ELSKAISVRTPKDTNLIYVDVEAGSRQNAIDWAQALCNAFVDVKKENVRRNSKSALVGLEEKTKNARARMLEDERQEMLYKKSHKLADVNTEQQAKVAEYVHRETDVANAQAELAAAKSKVDSLASRLRDANMSISTGDGVRDDQLVLNL